MAFGQSPGPPAGQRQLSRLLELMNSVGHSDFRDARGPLDLTQRQANGKFTRDEADALIELLEAEVEAHAGTAPAESEAVDAPPHPGDAHRRITRDERLAKEALLSLSDVADELLAAELQRRGWVVMEP
ncbi:MAG: hypothetical protein R2754_02635 [Microthrixaceae bacterium]